MFPNVRLMIAAVAASVVALSCGFGVFAAFRVNHEPLARLQSAPLQLVVGNAAPQSLLLAAIAPAEHIAQHGELRRAGAAAVAPSVLPAAPAAPPTAQSATAVTPAAEDGSAAARPAQAATAPSSAASELTLARDWHDAASQNASPQNAPSQDASSQATQRRQQTSQAGEPATPNRAAEASTELASTVAPSVAAIEAPLDQAPPVEQLKRDSETSPAPAPSEAVRATRVVPREAATKPKRTRIARARRSWRARPGAFAAAGMQSFASARPQFESAPQFQTAPPPRQRLVRVKVSARKTAKRHSAVGGPFVGAPTDKTPSQP